MGLVMINMSLIRQDAQLESPTSELRRLQIRPQNLRFQIRRVKPGRNKLPEGIK